MNPNPRRDHLDTAKNGRKGKRASPWSKGPAVQSEKNRERYVQMNERSKAAD